MRICLVTCRAYPTLSASDRVYAHALARRGCEVIAAPWNETTVHDFAAHDAIVLRATWDAPDDMAGFEDWSRAVEALGRPMFNNPSLARQNNDKRTLLDLGDHGIAMPRTVILTEQVSIEAAFGRLGSEWAVLKPCWGGSGVGVEKVRAYDADAVARLRAQLQRPLMLQEFLPEIADGELSFVFIRDQFTHAVLKRPAAGEFRVNSRYRPQAPERTHPPGTLIQDAAAALNAADEGTSLYARVDGVVRGGRLICTEIELCDPSLFFDLAPEAAEIMAEATIGLAGWACLSTPAAPPDAAPPPAE